MSITIEALDHLVINVKDVEASAAWYQRVLGMTRQDAPGTPVRTSVHFGQQKINLRPVSASKVDWFTADHEARRQRRPVLPHAVDRRRMSLPICARAASPSRSARSNGSAPAAT